MTLQHCLTEDNPFCQAFLQSYKDHVWTTMGFGMIRTYLDQDKRFRLNIWDSRLAILNVSTIHNHPWSFTSHVLCGLIKNQKYKHLCDTESLKDATHEYHAIKTGEEGGPVETPKPCYLQNQSCYDYGRGKFYYQSAEEVHQTFADTGTVTLNDRSAPSEAHTASVYWKVGTFWVDAKPRLATPYEVERAVESALSKLREKG